jgi:hypothetical protein
MKKAKLALPVLLTLFIVAAILLLPRLIKITKISCLSQYGPCGQELTRKLEAHQGQSLYRVKREASRELKSDNTIEDFSFQIKIPATLKIDLIENKALYALTAPDGNNFLVNKEGLVMKILPATSLPKVILEANPPNVGEKVTDNQDFALKIIAELWNLYQIREGSIVNDAFEVGLPNGIKVIFPLEGDKDIFIGSLQLILSRLNTPQKDSKISVSIIDLRFKNPVLK